MISCVNHRLCVKVCSTKGIISGMWMFNKSSFPSELTSSLDLYFKSPPDLSLNLLILILVLVIGYLNR